MRRTDIVRRLAFVAAGSTLLCACGGQQAAAEPQQGPENTAVTTSGAGAASEDTISDDQAEAIAEEIPAEYVAGSGSYFVKLTDGIYFHEYDKEAFEETVPGGRLLDYCLTPAVATTLCRYDEESGELTEIVKDGCTGRLYWLGDRFYCERYGENGSEVVMIPVDGGEAEVYGAGRIAGGPECYAGEAIPEGVGPEAAESAAQGAVDAAAESNGSGTSLNNAGGCLALWRFGESGTTLEVLGGSGEVLYTMAPDTVDYRSYCGLAGSSVIYRETDEEGIVTLFCYDGTKTSRLGELTKMGDYADPRCEQLFEYEGTVYCIMGWHSGVLDDYKDFQAVSFIPGAEDSLNMLCEGYDVLSMPKIEAYRPPHFELQDGSVSMNGQIPGTVSLSEGDYGDLILYLTPEESVLMADDLISFQDREQLKILSSQLFGDELYLMVAGVSRVPEEDHDWLRFYQYNGKMYYLRLSLSQGSPIRTGTEGEAAGDAEVADGEAAPAAGDTETAGGESLPAVYGAQVESFAGADWREAYSFDADFYEDFIGDWQISEIPAEGAENAEASGEEGSGRQASTRTTLISFTDDRHALVSQDLYVGGSYELSCEEADGKTVITGFCPLYGHHFTAWFENGELNVSFVQRMLSSWGDETKTWSGYYITAPEADSEG